MNTIVKALRETSGATLSITLHGLDNHKKPVYSLKVMNCDKGYQVSIEDLITMPIKMFNLDGHVEDLVWSELLKHIVNVKASKRIDEYNGAICIGLWIDKDELYIDLSQYIGDKDIAIKLGKKHNQKAIFEWSTKLSIYLD